MSIAEFYRRIDEAVLRLKKTGDVLECNRTLNRLERALREAEKSLTQKKKEKAGT